MIIDFGDRILLFAGGIKNKNEISDDLYIYFY